MSYELSGRVIGDMEITRTAEFTVMLALADSTNKKTMLCYPSHARIAALSRCSPRAAIRTLSALEKKGWIQIIRRKDPEKGNLANTYRITKYGVPPSRHPSDSQSPPLVTIRQKVVSTSHHPSDSQSPKPGREPVKEPINTNSFSLSADPEKKDKRRPASFEELLRFSKSDPSCIRQCVDRNDCQHYWDKMEDRGWFRDEKCKQPIKDWKANFREWATGHWLPSGKLPPALREEHVRKYKENRLAELRTAQNGDA